jgi:hypothetical protein
MLFEVYDRIIDLRRVREIGDIPNQVQGSHTTTGGGLRLVLEGLPAPMDISINIQNPRQAARLAIARQHLTKAWLGLMPTAGNSPRHPDDVYKWRDMVLDFSDVVCITDILRKDELNYTKTRKTRPTLNVVMNYSIHTTKGVFVHGTGFFNPEEHIARAAGMDFEHGKLLQAWGRYVDRRERRAA